MAPSPAGTVYGASVIRSVPPKSIATAIGLVGFLLAFRPGPASSAELKIATWDLGWLTQRSSGDPALPDNVLPKSPADLALLAGYAARLDADVVALQGVDDAQAARAVFPPDRYAVMLADDDVLQHTGFAVKLGLDVQRHVDLTALDPYPTARLHLRAGADVTVTVGRHALRLLAVHLKSGCRDARLDGDDAAIAERPACATLLRQASVLRDWVAARAAEDSAGSFVVLGDFARAMGADDLTARIGGDISLTRATSGHASPCWGPGPFTDDLLIGGPAALWVQPGSLRVMVYRETGADWHGRLSGHCPVSVRLTLPD